MAPTATATTRSDTIRTRYPSVSGVTQTTTYDNALVALVQQRELLQQAHERLVSKGGCVLGRAALLAVVPRHDVALRTRMSE